MANSNIEVSPQIYARTGGALYLAIILLGGFSEGYVTSQLLAAGDAARTAHNILAAPQLWRLGVAADLLVAMLAVPLLWIEYLLLRPVSRQWVLLAVLFNLVSIGVESISKLFLLMVMPSLMAAGALQAFTAEQSQGLASLALRSHDVAFNISLLFFGGTCIVNGWLIFRSGYLPRFVGVLMQLAGIAYLIACSAALFAPALANLIIPAILVLPLVGESSMSLWLLFKGVNVAKWREACARPAPA